MSASPLVIGFVAALCSKELNASPLDGALKVGPAAIRCSPGQ